MTVWDAREIGGLAAVLGMVAIVVYDVVYITGVVEDWHLYVLSLLVTVLLGIDVVIKRKYGRVMRAVIKSLEKNDRD